jgi:hypothetical protein
MSKRQQSFLRPRLGVGLPKPMIANRDCTVQQKITDYPPPNIKKEHSAAKRKVAQLPKIAGKSRRKLFRSEPPSIKLQHSAAKKKDPMEVFLQHNDEPESKRQLLFLDETYPEGLYFAY